MRVLMLGWEFPPFIAGGLGTACHGLTRALDRLGQDVLFVLPRSADGWSGSRVRVVGPNAIQQATLTARPDPDAGIGGDGSFPVVEGPIEGFERARFVGVPAGFSHPYPGSSGPVGGGADLGSSVAASAATPPREKAALDAAGVPSEPAGGRAAIGGHHYSGDMQRDCETYAQMLVRFAGAERFDVIHAHDWMTYPAGMALSRVSSRPMVAHIHSTEFDRSGENINQRVYDIERRGMHAAVRVVAVSRLTKSICIERYGISPDKIDVVYNGVEREDQQPAPGSQIESTDKIVLFLGRITMQKGPEYFVRAARRVLDRYENVKFVVAGSGDMAMRMIEEAAALGIGHKVLFTGFLRGKDVDRVFQMADCYVMPSVSEPFGIAPLEAMKNDVPVIISKQSGVSEVLTHALKVDFWDIDEMANKVIAVLRHPPLSQTLRQHGPMELRGLTWDGAAQRVIDIYDDVLRSVGQPVELG
ncbi:MAG: glycosyltransferase [Planctomycetota bacterium]